MPRILLVEDNEMNRDMLTRRLTRKGFDVLHAINGLEGVAASRQHRPDLVLMDLSLPEMDGLEATRRIKADPATCAIPVIALTAHAMTNDRERALAAGCDDYDTKPVDLARLLDKMQVALAGSRPMTSSRLGPDRRRRRDGARHARATPRAPGVSCVDGGQRRRGHLPGRRDRRSIS